MNLTRIMTFLRLKPEPVVPSFRRLVKETAISWKKHWLQLTLIAAIVSVPSAAAQLTGASSDAVLGGYISLAAIFMNLALIWSVIEMEDADRISIKRAYYQGAASIVRFLLVVIVLTLMSIPFLIGALIYAQGSFSSTIDVPSSEKALLALLWLVLALPTIWWLTRYVFSIYAVQSADTGPIQALRASKRVVKGKGWMVFWRLLAMSVATLLLLSLPAVIISLLTSAASPLLDAAVQLFSSIIVLPLFYIYLYKLYRSLI